jgi:hypothetical protein
VWPAGSRNTRKGFTLGPVDVIDGDVEMELLRSARIGERRRLVVRRQLKRQSTSGVVGQHDPGVVLLGHSATDDALVERREL